MPTQPPINTFKRGKRVICPACGASICTHDPSSFLLRPNNMLRGHLNGLIVDLRNFTRGLDANLSNAMTSLPLHDIYGTPYAREEILTLIEKGLLENAVQLDLGGSLVTGGFFPDPYTEELIKPEAAVSASRPDQPPFKNLFKETELAQLQRESPPNLSRLLSPAGEFRATYRANEPQGRQRAAEPGSYGIPRTRLWAEYFERQVDPYDFSQTFSQLGPLPDEQERELTEEQLTAAIKLLLGVGLERRSNGLLLDLALEQPKLRDFMLNGRFTKAEEAIKKILSLLRPGLSRYFEKIEQAINGGTRTSEERVQIKQNLQRARLLLLLLHGHGYSCLPGLERDNMETAFAEVWTLEFRELFLENFWVVTEKSAISTLLLSRMLNSIGFFRDSNLALQTSLGRLPPDANAQQESELRSSGTVQAFLQLLRERFFRRFTKTATTSSTATNDLVFEWDQHIDSLVTVHCASDIKVRTTISKTTSQPADFTVLRKLRLLLTPGAAENYTEVDNFAPCDYMITAQNTFSIVILGSMGAGKTCAFTTGLARLWQFGESLKLDIGPTDPETLLKLERIRKQYQNGEVENPTEFNVTVNLKVSSLPEGHHPSRVSILDIPGETVFSLISGTGQDSELRRIMKSANAVVFLFDIWSDTVVSDHVKRANNEAFKSALENKTRTEEARREKQGSSVDQRLLLQRLYELLQEERTAERVKKIPFICLFPKADLLVSGDSTPTQDSDSPYILRELFVRLGEAGLLINSNADNRNPGSVFRSSAGICPNVEKLRELMTEFNIPNQIPENCVWGKDFPGNFQEMIAYQESVAKLISTMFEKVLRGHVSNMLGTSPQTADKQSFADRVQAGVLDFIKHRFEQCYFLPVSALGKSPEKAQPTAGSKFFQKLSVAPQSVFVEYSFLIPVILALKDCLHQTPPAEQ